MSRFFAFTLLTAAVWAQSPPTITSVLQIGTNPQLTPGSWALLKGSALGTSGTGFGTLPKISVNGVNGPVTASLDDRAFFQIPATTPVGPASVVVTTSAGSSAAFPVVLVAISPSPIFSGGNPSTYYWRSGSDEIVNFPVPGDNVEIGFTGLGSAIPLPLPKLFIDGAEFPLTATGARHFGVIPAPYATQSVIFQVPDLQPGHHTVVVQAGGVNSPAIPLDLIYSGIITSQTGLTFNAVAGGPVPLGQSFSVLSGAGTINFNLTPSTVSGGSWLSVSPQVGSAQVGQVGSPIKVTVDPTGLAAGAYYGTVQVSANGVLNSSQSVTVVLRVAPAGTPVGPYLDTTGLIFVGTQGGSDPASQTVMIANPTAGTLTMSGGSGTINQFSFSPSVTVIPSGQSAALNVQATLKGAAPGTYTARIPLTFSDGSKTTINLLLVVVSTAAPKTGAPLDAGGCTPSKLLPVFQQPGASFSVAAAWPTPIQVSVVDDCAVPLTTGGVSVSFSNGDQALALLSLRNGMFAATWAAVKPVATGVTITATASDPVSALSATAAVAVGVAANPDVPIITKGGVVDAASNGSALSPGSLINVYGAKLSATAGAANGLPWSSTLNNTTVLMGGKPLPLDYTSDGQVIAIVPYDVPLNTSLQLVARSGNALSSPQPALIVPARPGVFVMDASGQGAIVGGAGLANPSSPVKPGDVVVVYCTGLGAVDPPVQAGMAASLTTLSSTVNSVTATVGGKSATVLFAGVTPGSSGLYQVNLTLPAGLPDNDATTLVLSANGQDSAQVTLAVRTPK